MDHRCWESLKEMFTIAFKFVYSLFLNSEGGLHLPHIHSLGCSVHGASNSSLDCGHPAIELLFFFLSLCLFLVCPLDSLLWLCLRTLTVYSYMVNCADRPGCSGNDGISTTRDGLELHSSDSLRPLQNCFLQRGSKSDTAFSKALPKLQDQHFPFLLK